MTPNKIGRQEDLAELLEDLQDAGQIGVDTEFVSEDTFHPELCLIQIATRDKMAVVDPQLVDVRPFWRLLADHDETVIFHAGREELNFMLRAVGAAPQRLFDVQIGAGFCGNEYPAAYNSVVSRLLGHKPLKGEQRTDWRRRPLSDSQIRYALEDVRYLLPLYDRLSSLLQERGRLSWFHEEMSAWRASVLSAQDRKDWRRVSGIGKINAQGLAVVRELWQWRQQQAERLNQPVKRILRDDLIVELAKRRTDRPDQILAIRGLQRNDLKRKAHELAACVRRGLD
ncbi:MAG: HRDC domain-containing protein, partial [Planctomycetota bacterium]